MILSEIVKSIVMTLSSWPRPIYSNLPSLPDGTPQVLLTQAWKAPSGYVIRAPFISDMSSVPAPFWGLFRPRDAAIAGLLHDAQFTDAEFGLYSYAKANREWLSTAIHLDRLLKWKAVVAYLVLEILRVVQGRR
jgi:hypothetical protein